MNLFYFFQNYLNKLDDVQFCIKWEKFVHNNVKRFVYVVLFIWIIGSLGVGYLLILLVGVFFGIILTGLFSMYLGYILFIQTIRFLAVNNGRYIQSKMNIDDSVINYDNVVG